jgi:rubrerythrin
MQPFDIVQLIETLASIEKEGAAFYESLAEHAGNEKVKSLANTMARVEKSHQHRFEELAKTIKKRSGKQAPDKITASVRQYIHALIDQRIFDSPEHAKKLGMKISDENEAVDMAIRFEKENILLLLECATIARGKARELIQVFINQEKAHIRSLQKMRTQLSAPG